MKAAIFAILLALLISCNAVKDAEKKIFDVDPIEMKNPELSTEWRQYRLNAVTRLVNELVVIAHESGNKLSAAVFPFPEMSRQMVRQAWNDWNLDAAYPMLYQNFYRQNINWIGFASEQAVNDVDFPIVAGLFEPAFNNAKAFEQGIRLAKEKGASGVSVFTADGLSIEMQQVIKKLSKEL
ncbi:hypothetical protein [Saccharicrinis fermentans]|uniref:Uncharacterized protein n=1 Tax=Saccharicrinis fermentans DSM 9555 = JCM 21142 TaxID=869213 RepID=W7Y7X7_9BACT|nr:hypothetical protein [Saccharicrinis fermentans]GAF03773.1 hypothetical protein JCM21142_62455 [Saccharicrinis fermentans DSM 9555 = JCM 21142]